MSLFERVFDRERLMFLAVCAGIIDDRGKSDEYIVKSRELGAAIFDAIDESFDSHEEKVVFCSTLLMFIDEILQDESDDAWDRYSKAVIDEQIGGMSDG